MNYVWEHSPATVRDVHSSLQLATGWSYSTVKTLMQRLVEKQALAVERHGAANYFQPLASRLEARRSALGGLLESAFSGGVAGLVQHLLSERQLKPAELEQLQNLLDEARREEGQADD